MISTVDLPGNLPSLPEIDCLDSKFTSIITTFARAGMKNVLFGLIAATNYQFTLIFNTKNYLCKAIAIEHICRAGQIPAWIYVAARYNDSR